MGHCSGVSNEASEARYSSDKARSSSDQACLSLDEGRSSFNEARSRSDEARSSSDEAGNSSDGSRSSSGEAGHSSDEADPSKQQTMQVRWNSARLSHYTTVGWRVFQVENYYSNYPEETGDAVYQWIREHSQA